VSLIGAAAAGLCTIVLVLAAAPRSSVAVRLDFLRPSGAPMLEKLRGLRLIAPATLSGAVRLTPDRARWTEVPASAARGSPQIRLDCKGGRLATAPLGDRRGRSRRRSPLPTARPGRNRRRFSHFARDRSQVNRSSGPIEVVRLARRLRRLRTFPRARLCLD